MSEITTELIQLALDGDQDASRDIVEMLHKPVLATIHRFLGRRFLHEVEDIAQEIFLKVFRTLNRFDPNRGVKFTTWVFTFVRNHCFDILKKKRIFTASIHGEDLDGEERNWELPDPSGRKPDERMLDSELGRQIENAIQALSEEQRMVFVLREFEQLDLKSIAAVMECSEGTVKSRLHRAKEAMKRKLEVYLRT